MANTVQDSGLRKLQDSLREQETLFGNASPARERRDARLARLGLIICVFVTSLAAFAELSFIVCLVYDLFR